MSDKTTIQITNRQQVALCLFLLNNVKPANRDERRRYRQVFGEFKINALKDQCVAGKFEPSSVTDLPVQLDVSKDCAAYVLEKTNTQMDGVTTFPILELEEVLLLVQAGGYVLPSQAPALQAAE
jgi:hypothetical protein